MNDTLQLSEVEILGMPLTLFAYKGVTGTLTEVEEEGWATIYSVKSSTTGKGQCQECLRLLKEHYEAKGLRFGCSVALNPAMRHILQKLGIHEYSDDDDELEAAPCE